MSDYDIRPFRPGDEAGLVATFNATFGENDPNFVPRTMEEWRWAFEANPAGQRIWVAEAEDGTIAAQCAALPYRVRIDGRDHTFTQGVDSMVHPDHRRGLRRPGLFVATAKPFFRQYGGLGGDILHYGWPVEPAWRIGKTFLGYEIVRTQTILLREMDPGSSELPDGVQAPERFGDEVLELYERCARDWGTSLLRDAAYMNWRFVDRPGVDYDLLTVRSASGGLAGLAVFRRADWPVADTGLVMDWLVPPDEPAVAGQLHEALCARARATGCRTLLAVMPDVSPWFARFQDWAWRVHSSDYLLIGIIQDPRYDTFWLRRNWWYQLAELDVV